MFFQLDKSGLFLEKKMNNNLALFSPQNSYILRLTINGILKP